MRRCARASRASSSSSASRTPGAPRGCWTRCAPPTRSSPASAAPVAAPASCSRPISTRATSSRSPSCAERSSPSGVCRAQGDPGLELGAVAAALERALDPAAALEPRAEGPWLPAERYSEALLLAQAFAGRAPGVVAVACRAPDALALKRVAAARSGVPLREPLPPGRHPRAEELAAVA